MKPATILLQERIERFESSLVENQKRIEQLERQIEEMKYLNHSNRCVLLEHKLSTANNSVKVLREALEHFLDKAKRRLDQSDIDICEQALSTTQP